MTAGIASAGEVAAVDDPGWDRGDHAVHKLGVTDAEHFGSLRAF
jgi:hypothetical protein